MALITCENHPVGLVTGDAPSAKNSPMMQPMVAETMAMAIVATQESHTRQMNPQFGLRKPSSTGAARCKSSHSGVRVNPMPDPAHQVTPSATIAPSTGIAEVRVLQPISKMSANKLVPISGYNGTWTGPRPITSVEVEVAKKNRANTTATPMSSRYLPTEGRGFSGRFFGPSGVLEPVEILSLP